MDLKLKFSIFYALFLVENRGKYKRRVDGKLFKRGKDGNGMGCKGGRKEGGMRMAISLFCFAFWGCFGGVEGRE